MKDPLQGFAERLARNGEIREFILGLIRENFISAKDVKVLADEGDISRPPLDDIQNGYEDSMRQHIHRFHRRPS